LFLPKSDNLKIKRTSSNQFFQRFQIASVPSKNKKKAGHWWLTPVILATQEAKIRRISVQSQLSK
jgi:hypothetical protein